MIAIDVLPKPFFSGYAFKDKMIVDGGALFVQGGLRDNCVFQDGLLIAVDEGWLEGRDAKHVQLEANASHIFTAGIHCSKLCTKHSCLDESLLFGVPVDRILI